MDIDNKRGGYAIAVTHNDELVANDSGSEYGFDVTNNRMEMRAISMAIDYAAVLPNASVKIVSDSEYCVKCLNEYIPKWSANKWRKKNGDIANLELWQEIWEKWNPERMGIEWVKAHNGNKWNEYVDVNAGKMAKLSKERD